MYMAPCTSGEFTLNTGWLRDDAGHVPEILRETRVPKPEVRPVMTGLGGL